jgi:hypothetical protein
MNARISITGKKRGDEQVVRSSWRVRIGFKIQFQFSIERKFSGSARIRHGGCYVMSKGKIKLVGFLVVG